MSATLAKPPQMRKLRRSERVPHGHDGVVPWGVKRGNSWNNPPPRKTLLLHIQDTHGVKNSKAKLAQGRGVKLKILWKKKKVIKINSVASNTRGLKGNIERRCISRNSKKTGRRHTSCYQGKVKSVRKQVKGKVNQFILVSKTVTKLAHTALYEKQKTKQSFLEPYLLTDSLHGSVGHEGLPAEVFTN